MIKPYLFSDSTLLMFPDATHKATEKNIASFFNGARDRFGGRENRRKKVDRKNMVSDSPKSSPPKTFKRRITVEESDDDLF